MKIDEIDAVKQNTVLPQQYCLRMSVIFEYEDTQVKDVSNLAPITGFHQFTTKLFFFCTGSYNYCSGVVVH